MTVAKAKNYHDPIMRFLLSRLGVVPLASKGYLLLVDFTGAIGRRPDDAEYRALRDRLERGAPWPAGEPFEALATRPRALLGHAFDPAAEPYRAFVQRVYAEEPLGETLRLAREAVAAGADVQMYPEGTVAPRLGRGRPGAVQLAWALGLPIVPVGMSGCPDAFAGDSPLLRVRPGGAAALTIRFGRALTLPPNLLPADFRPFNAVAEATHRAALVGYTDDVLMPAIEALLDPPFRRGEAPSPGKGTRAFL